MSDLKIKKRELLSLFKSFKFAFAGFLYCVHNERNMRIHIAAATCVTVFSTFYRVTRNELVSLLILYSIVIVTEMLNTAMEVIVNLQSPAYHTLARIAKDVAAAAVLISSVVAVLIGLVLFSDLNRLLPAIMLIFTNPYLIALFALLIILSILFVFKGYKLIYKLIKHLK